MKELFDGIEALKDEIKELKKRCDAQKKFIQVHHADIEELKNPKKAGGMDDL
jgi:hypothetical protein